MSEEDSGVEEGSESSSMSHAIFSNTDQVCFCSQFLI